MIASLLTKYAGRWIMKKLIYSLLTKAFRGLADYLYDEMLDKARFKAAQTKTEWDDNVVSILAKQEVKDTLLGKTL